VTTLQHKGDKLVREIDDHSVIALDRFIQATRDSGYRGTVSAVSELIDNALQASARRVSVRIEKIEELEEFPVMLSVLDDGCGMEPKVLRQALRFGGSTRFNNRSGLGRYGMGLPNASFSQARRVEVFSWVEFGRVHYTYLDLDEIASGEMRSIPLSRRVEMPEGFEEVDYPTGTIVVWTWCDRLDNRRISTLEQKLRIALGRIFRYFLWNGVEITVNGQPLIPVDPLFLAEPALTTGGVLFDEPLVYEVRAPTTDSTRGEVGKIVVTFSELPVSSWYDLPNEEKRRLGVTNGAGVSVVRGGREIDYGWFFLSGKRRENYDDWWRAEVRFEPVLDEMFGITHTKQEIRPHESLLEILAGEMSEIARILNARVRTAHTAAKSSRQTQTAENLAQTRDDQLREVRERQTHLEEQDFIDRVRLRHGSQEGSQTHLGREYRIVEDDTGGSAFYRPVFERDRITVVLNPRHRFYKRLYRPLVEGGATTAPQDVTLLLQLLLLSAARAEAAANTSAEARAIAAFREEWSAVLEVLFKP
jgi:hypothetical protein